MITNKDKENILSKKCLPMQILRTKRLEMLCDEAILSLWKPGEPYVAENEVLIPVKISNEEKPILVHLLAQYAMGLQVNVHFRPSSDDLTEDGVSGQIVISKEPLEMKADF